MKLSISIFTSLACSLVMGELLVGYDASRGDAVAEMGPLLNLEKSDDDRVPSNIPNLYIKKDKDWSGTPCAHVHRKQRYTRAEYHALKDQIKAGQTYYMGYRFAVNQLQAGTFIFQWKEYADTNETDLGMSIPFYLRFGSSGNLQLQAGRPGMSPIVIWEKAILSRKVIDIGMEIVPKRQSGTVKMWYNGNRVTFNIDGNKNQVWKGTTMPESSSPKWGAYRGEEAQIDTWIYKVQFGQNKGELDQAFFSA